MIRFAPLAILFVSAASAELTVSTAETYHLAGVDHVSVYPSSGVVLVAPDEVGRLRTDPAVVITVRAEPASVVLVSAIGEGLHDSPLTEITEPGKPPTEAGDLQIRQYLITAKGRHAVLIRAVNSDQSIDRETLAITIGKPKQTGVPPDEFDDIGQRIAEWSAGCTENATYSRLYQEAAEKMAESPESVSITSQNRELEMAVADQIDNLDQYQKMREAIAIDTLSRYKAMDRQQLGRYWAAIARGLKAAKGDDTE